MYIMFLNAQSSLIPTVVGLSEFFIGNFPHVGWYPYWYLGNPFHFLIGPVVPVLLLLLSKVFFVSLYHLYITVIVGSMVTGGIGIYFFILNLKFAKRIGLIAGFLYFLLPFSWVGLYFGNGLKQVGLGVVPFVFLVYWKWVIVSKKYLLRRQAGMSKVKSRTDLFLLFVLVLLIGLCLLVNAGCFLAVLIGMICVYVSIFGKLGILRESETQRIGRSGIQSFRSSEVSLVNVHLFCEEVVGKSVFVILGGIGVASFWYTPSFWWVVLGNPSFGGVAMWRVIGNVFQSVFSFFPIILAVLVVKWRHYKVSGLLLFGVLFFVSFLFLTGVRLLANPMFVMDWLGFLPELQLGVAILGALSVYYFEERWLSKNKKYFLKVKSFLFILPFIVVLGIVSGVLVKGFIFYSDNGFSNRILLIISSQHIRQDERVFLSGSGVFWVNEYLPLLAQVRGGNDGVAMHSSWADGAYQIREGEDAALARDWLSILGSDYILIHQFNSYDLFHDFKHMEKYHEFAFLKGREGDDLYRVGNVHMGRIAKKDLLQIGRPFNGADDKTLSSYVSNFFRPAELEFVHPDVLRVKGNLRKDELVSLAVTYDPGWHLVRGSGEIVRDSLGNMVIVPEKSGEQEFVLEYSRGMMSWVGPLVVCGLIFVLLWQYELVIPLIRRRMPRLSFGLGEDDEY